LLGNTQNTLHSQLSQPVILQTSNGFNCRAGDSDTVKLNASNIIIHRDIYLDDFQVRKLKEPNADDDAETKGYVDRTVNTTVYIAPVMSGSLDMGLNSIINVKEPGSSSDAAT
jgi:hypothetical protein